MRHRLCCLALLSLLFVSPFRSQNPVIQKLFRGSFRVYEDLRYPSGVYRAKLPLSGTANTFAAISVTGMGLVALCIADSMQWTLTAKAQALLTIKSMLGYTAGFHPVRNPSGFFEQFIDPVSGQNSGSSPFSTIDNAVLVSGVLFCKNYFKDDSISFYADKLWNGYNWAPVIADASNAKLYLTLDSTGNGTGASTRLYNEYVLVAWLARGQECSNNQTGPATQLWNQFCDNPDNYLFKPVYQGVTMIGALAGSYQPEHVMNMPHYLCHRHTVSARYAYYMNNMRKADSLWWKTTHKTQVYEWGMSAGSGISQAYLVDAINNNPDTIVSPHAMAGFLPIYPQAKNDLVSLYNTHKGVYALASDTSMKILWRYSPAQPSWKATVLQGVDFAPFLFGLASLPENLGIGFFARNNDFFDPQVNTGFSPSTICAGGCLNFTDQSTLHPTWWSWSFPGSSLPSSGQQNPTNICYSTSGSFTVTLQDSNRCGSNAGSRILLVHPLPATPTITQNGSTLTSSAAVSYQWLLNNVPVSGATQQTLSFSSNGSYAVCITDANGCQACSLPLTPNGIGEYARKSPFTLFPNPARTEVQVSGTNTSGDYLFLRIWNTLGQCVYEEEYRVSGGQFSTALNVNGFPPGFYSVVFQTNNSWSVQRLEIN